MKEEYSSSPRDKELQFCMKNAKDREKGKKEIGKGRGTETEKKKEINFSFICFSAAVLIDFYLRHLKASNSFSLEKSTDVNFSFVRPLVCYSYIDMETQIKRANLKKRSMYSLSSLLLLTLLCWGRLVATAARRQKKNGDGYDLMLLVIKAHEEYRMVHQARKREYFDISKSSTPCHRLYCCNNTKKKKNQNMKTWRKDLVVAK